MAFPQATLTSAQAAALAGIGTTSWLQMTCASQNIRKLVIGGTGATYSQTGTTVTVTWAAHGLTADKNAAQVYLTQSTGALLTGWFTNFTYVDANTFTCVSTVSQSTSGNLGANVTAMTLATHVVPAGGLGPNGTVFYMASASHKSSANVKTLETKYGAYQSYINTPTSTLVTSWVGGLGNQNSTTSQVNCTTPYGTGLGSTAVVPAVGTVDSTIAQNVTYVATLASAADWVCLEMAKTTYQYAS
jgi:hypothetical protein